RNAPQAPTFNSASARSSDECAPSSMVLLFVCRTENFTRNSKGASHAKWPKPIMSARQPRPTASFAARSKRWTALARAEAQNGNTVGAENYYQYAEHYFRSMSSEREGT